MKPSNRPVEWQTSDIENAVTKHMDRLLRTAVATMGCMTEAEDIVQETFLRLYEHQPRFESLSHETAWLIRVTVNLCKSRLRSHWWRKSAPLLDIYPAADDFQHDLVETVFALPHKYRAVIHLYYYEGYQTKEIAEITTQSEAAVRQQLSRARQMIKNSLKGEYA